MAKTTRLKSARRVALLIETSTAFGRGILRGIHAYIREHGPWATYLPEPEHGDTVAPPLRRTWDGDGIIARIDNRELAKELAKRRGVPVVDVCADHLLTGAPCVETDDRAIARIAAEHLLERGFKQFAYCGDDRFTWARMRGEYFAQHISAAGMPCQTFECEHSPKRLTAEQETQQLAKWVSKLPKPVGIMACHDFRGWQILEACRTLGVCVPEEVAVIGVDNDELLCELADPPLSSVIPNAPRIGYRAAETLDAWMNGKPTENNVLVEPAGIVTRHSSDVFAVADVNLAQAIRFIRQHACDGIHVEDVLNLVPLTRAALDNEFKRLLGHTAHEEIRRVQFQRVKELLKETTIPLAVIAERTGFKHAEYMTFAFKQRFGVPPSAFREQSASHDRSGEATGEL